MNERRLSELAAGLAVPTRERILEDALRDPWCFTEQELANLGENALCELHEAVGHLLGSRAYEIAASRATRERGGLVEELIAMIRAQCHPPEPAPGELARNTGRQVKISSRAEG